MQAKYWLFVDCSLAAAPLYRKLSLFGSRLLQNRHNAVVRSFASTVCSTYKIIFTPCVSFNAASCSCSSLICPGLFFSTEIIKQGMSFFNKEVFTPFISVYFSSKDSSVTRNRETVNEKRSSLSSSNFFVPSIHILPPKPILLQL